MTLIFIRFFRILIVPVLLLASHTAVAGALADIVREALVQDPEVRASRHRADAREAEWLQARGALLPSVDVNAGIGYEYTDSPATRSGGGGSEDLRREELGLRVGQLLYDGGASRRETERQKLRLTSAQHRLRGTAESRALAVVQAYLEVLRRRQLQQLAADNLAAHQRIQDQIRLRSEAGVGRRADLEQINARVALAHSNVESAGVNLLDADTTYLRATGTMPPDRLEAPDDPGTGLPSTLESAVDQALGAHPLLRVAAADIEAAEAQREVAQGQLYPRVDLEVDGNLNDDLDGVRGRNRDVAVMLRMRYNLYRGGANQARIRQTASEVGEAMDLRERTRRQVEETLRLAWAARNATSRQLEYALQRVRFSEATRDAYKKQFNIGQRTLLDLLNTENEVFQARQALAETRIDHTLSGYRILEATGRLLDDLGIELASTGL